MKSKEVILIVRRNRDYWLSGEYKSSLNPWLIDIMGMWNDLFKMDIICYRNKLRDISSSFYMKNKFDKIFLHFNRDPKRMKESISKEELKLHEKTIFVPVDEDDWIDPSLSEVLREIETDNKLFVWDYLSTIKNGESHSNKGEGMSFVQSCAWGSVGYDYLLNRRNNLYIKKDYNNVYFINKPLSVKVEHAGSVGFLRKTIKKFPDQRERWVGNLVKKIEEDIKIEIDFPKVFKEEWKEYKCLLKELLSSYNFLVSREK